jgi:16S rRNA (adenine1518-N6/adenine1519-N6)-dimethyltransferase
MKVHAKRHFGQHFLRDTAVIERILRHLRPLPNDLFLEVGAGTGALSASLAESGAGLVAVEIDPDCRPHLEGVLSGFAAAHCVSGDILALDIAEILRPYLQPAARLRAAGNLPYNIATAVIERLLDGAIPFADLTFMVQLEVAQRITARPGTKPYGYFSVMCQRRAEARLLFRVAPGSFQPRPKVLSAVVGLQPRIRLERAVDEAVDCVAKAAFSHRRKTIANSLRLANLEVSPARLLAAGGIDPRRRPEELSIAEYESLGRQYLRLRESEEKTL